MTMNFKTIVTISILTLGVSLTGVTNAKPYATISLRWNFDGDTKPDFLRIAGGDYSIRDISKSNSVIDTKNSINGTLDFENAKIILSQNDITNLNIGGGFKAGDEFYGTSYAPGASLETLSSNMLSRNSNKISGFEFGLNINLNSDWKKPSVDISGLFGTVKAFAKLGVGYDTRYKNVTFPASAILGRFLEVGVTNLKNPSNTSFISLGGYKGLAKLKEKIINSKISSKKLCDSNLDHYFEMTGFGNNTNTFSFCHL